MYILESVITGCSSPGIGRILLILKNILTLTQIIGPILLIIAMTKTFTKMMANPEEKKLKKNLINQLISTLFLFMVPIIVNAFMGIVDDSFSVSSCWNSLSNSSGEATYHSPTQRELSPLMPNRGDYEPGEERKPANNGTGESSGSSIEGTALTYKDVVWDSNNISRISNLTSAQLIKILNAYGGNARNLIPYAANYITAENKYNVNVFFLIALNALESGWGTSAIARNCNNLGGVCASANHPSKGCGSNSNCSFARFNSVGDFIDYNANMLHNNYLTPGGSYYEGTNLSQVYTKHYCPGCNAAASTINSIASGLFNKTRSVM